MLAYKVYYRYKIKTHNQDVHAGDLSVEFTESLTKLKSDLTNESFLLRLISLEQGGELEVLNRDILSTMSEVERALVSFDISACSLFDMLEAAHIKNTNLCFVLDSL